ncbi:MAG: NHL domain-containing protein, partial [Gammaproteobacteria bacterium]
LSLHYRNDRTPGRTAGRTISIPLSGPEVPSSLRGIRLTVDIAGQRVVETFPAAPNQTKSFVWNGLDGYGREIPHAATIVRIEYIYRAQYYRSRSDFDASFAIPGASVGNFIGNVRRSSTISLARTWIKSVSSGSHVIPSAHLGQLTLSKHHYITDGKKLFRGDGSSRKAKWQTIETVAGTGVFNYSGDGGQAIDASFEFPFSMAIDAAGDYFVIDNLRVRKISRDGSIDTVAGNGTFDDASLGDGGAAVNASIAPAALAFDSKGNLYLADAAHHRIRKVDRAGVITTVAGNGVKGFGGDGGPATAASLARPNGIAFDGEDNL